MARWRYDAQPLLRYAAVQEAPLYREIMEVFAEAAADDHSRLSPKDIYAALLDRLDDLDQVAPSALTAAFAAARQHPTPWPSTLPLIL